MSSTQSAVPAALRQWPVLATVLYCRTDTINKLNSASDSAINTETADACSAPSPWTQQLCFPTAATTVLALIIHAPKYARTRPGLPDSLKHMCIRASPMARRVIALKFTQHVPIHAFWC
jgi:hypothetical protein